MIYGIGRGIAELENSNSPDNAPENFMAAKQTGNCSARKRVLEGGLRNWKTAIPRTMPQRISWLQSRQEIALREKGYRKGDCGTGKQQFPGQCPREFHGCKADRKLLCVKKGIGRGIAELE